MSLFAMTKSLMNEYIDKINEIYTSTVHISDDVNKFTSGDTDEKLNSVKSSIDDVKSAIDNLDTDNCDDDTKNKISDIASKVDDIKNNNADAISDIADLKKGYNIVKTTVDSLQPSMKDWIGKSSKIFGETVKLLEKAKAAGSK